MRLHNHDYLYCNNLRAKAWLAFNVDLLWLVSVAGRERFFA
jgi:hypothetical protein